MGKDLGPATSRRALALIAGVFVAAGVALVLQLFRIQLVGHERLETLAQAHQLRRVMLEPERGRLFDRHGRLFAFTTDNLSVYAMRHEVTDARAVAAALDSIGVPGRAVRERLNDGRGFAWLSRELLPEAHVVSIAERFAGVYTRREPKRVHPMGALARQTLGSWSPDEGLTSGLERRYAEQLTGEPGWETVVLDAVGNRYATGTERPPRAGLDLVLTFDARIQVAAEEALRACVMRHDAAGGAVIVVDPATGDVLAMANHGAAHEGPGSRNRAVLDAIEVGSCAKTFTIAAALEDAGCDTTRRVFCGVRPDEEHPPIVRDDHGKPETLSLQMVVAQSRNTGTARIARIVGAERLHRFLAAFGFGRSSGIDMPAESSGVLRPLDEWSGRSLETVAIGYEFSATPIQLTMAYAAVAGEGRLLKPRLVRAFVDPETGRIRRPETEVVRRVISEETARTLRAVLRRATEPGGTGVAANVPGTSVAGKTGTARKYDPKSGGYSYRNHMSSFIGFVPHDEPRYVCAVFIDDPRGAYYGSEVAAPVFRRVVEKLTALDPLRLRSDVRTVSVTAPPAAIGPGEVHAAPTTGRTLGEPDLRGLSTLEARRLAARLGVRVEVLGSGHRVVHQERGPGGVIVLSTPGERPSGVRVPDLEGLGVREALERLAGAGLSIERRGVGRVLHQTPPAGATLAPGACVTVFLGDVARVWGVSGWSS